MSDIVCAMGTIATTFAVTSEATAGNVGLSILASIVSAIVFAALNIVTKIITSMLEKKGLISSKDKRMIDNVADDLVDDGKVNGSNAKDQGGADEEDPK